MGQGRAPGSQRQGPGAAKGLGQGGAEQAQPFGHLGEGAEDEPATEADSGGGQGLLRLEDHPAGQGDQDGEARRQRQPLADALQIPPLPRQQRPGGQDQQGCDHQRVEGQGEIGRPDRNGRTVGGLEDQRIEGAEQDGGTGRGQEDIVQHQRTLAADRGEHAAPLQLGRAPGEQGEGHAGGGAEDGQQHQAALGIDGKGMDTGQDAGADEEGPQHGEGEGQQGEKGRPAREGSAPLGDHGRVQQGRPGQPGQEAGILDGIPEPPAAPAELIIGPE